MLHHSPSNKRRDFDMSSFLQKTLSNFDIAASVSDQDYPDQKNKISENETLRVPLLPQSVQVEILDETRQIQQQNPPSGFDPRCSHMPPPPLTARSLKRTHALTASIDTLRPICRICHLPSERDSKTLIAPCRCAGTMKYVHTECLVHWLEISAKKMISTPRCELCGYMYKRQTCFRPQLCHMPFCTQQDRLLHTVFVLVFLIMCGCAAMSILFLGQNPRGRYSGEPLSIADVLVIVCSILFFCCFFIAVFTQYRAEASLCRIVLRCCSSNRNWRIRDYDVSEDEEYRNSVKQQRQQQMLLKHSQNTNEKMSKMNQELNQTLIATTTVQLMHANS